MTQKERQERSRREILRAAMEEFGTQDYDAVTMDSICGNHGISKGMMYHYYPNKDALFLLCVQVTFQDLRDHIRSSVEQLEEQGGFEAIKAYFLLREQYFQEHPMEKNVFENALLRPPRHLREQIWALRAPVRELNHQFIWRVVGRMPLREGLRQEAVMRYLDSVEYSLPHALRQYSAGGDLTDMHTLMEAVGELLDLVLYGVIRQE